MVYLYHSHWHYVLTQCLCACVCVHMHAWQGLLTHVKPVSYQLATSLSYLLHFCSEASVMGNFPLTLNDIKVKKVKLIFKLYFCLDLPSQVNLLVLLGVNVYNKPKINFSFRKKVIFEAWLSIPVKLGYKTIVLFYINTKVFIISTCLKKVFW